jgi:hypothetical protein|tara:strand:+ start:2193 stop:3116 length:924 start_codon:yes stop_codon:yes gene_type:complete
MAYITQYQYYENGGVDPTDANWGSYQYVSLEDIVNNFMLMYAGNHSLVNNEERFKILFHAKRAIQELNYDAFKEIKILELEVSDTLRFVLPSDYVNWVRVSQYRDGLMYPLSENIQTNWSQAYLQDNNYNILFDQDGAALSPEFSTLDTERIFGGAQSIYLNQGSVMNGREGWNVDGNWYFQYGIGARFGLNTETANINPTFKINPKGGVINFSSGMSGEICVLEYVSDGMENGDDSSVTVNKMFEEFIYAYIEYAVLGSKVGVQEYIVTRLKKKKTALLRNAKIRISNIHPGRLLQNLRGRDKWIK